MSAVDYLKIPGDYDERLGGLRWSSSGEAVELANGATFALAPEIGLFVSGFAGRARLIHFVHLLQALSWFGRERPPVLLAELRQKFVATGRKHRNAGALVAHLTRKVPRTAAPVDADEVVRILKRSVSAVAQVVFDEVFTQADDSERGPHLKALVGALEGAAREVPPLGFDELERLVARELRELSSEEIETWLRHGEPVATAAAEKVAEAVLAEKPTLEAVLARTAERPRLEGALPLVARLASAHVLPPRRLASSELPLGGYADITTRGHLEQLLPSQLALDPLELVRRFAGNELLFFRREEPRERTREDLVILLDQGARTWGPVRVALAAAALALARRAGRRGVTCLFAATSNAGKLVEPTDALGELLEASDLTLAPAQALEAVLAAKSEGTRDVVLLTHPRSLVEPLVVAAARRAAGTTRLFAVTADEAGAVELAQVRGGAALPLARLRVELTPPAPPPPPRVDGWHGDVERVPFPFAFGPTGQLGPRSIDFDESNRWLLVVGGRGMLFAYRVCGTAAEVWPRASAPAHEGAPLEEVELVLGVAGGFVLCGIARGELVVAHYDLAERRVRTHVLAKEEMRDPPTLCKQANSIRSASSINLPTRRLPATRLLNAAAMGGRGEPRRTSFLGPGAGMFQSPGPTIIELETPELDRRTVSGRRHGRDADRSQEYFWVVVVAETLPLRPRTRCVPVPASAAPPPGPPGPTRATGPAGPPGQGEHRVADHSSHLAPPVGGVRYKFGHDTAEVQRTRRRRGGTQPALGSYHRRRDHGA